MDSKCLATAASPTVRDEEAQGGGDLLPSLSTTCFSGDADTFGDLGGGRPYFSVQVRNERTNE